MNLIKLIEEVKDRVNLTNKIEVNETIENSKVSADELKKIESYIGIEFPYTLRELYLNYASQVRFSWTTEENIFGKQCKNGRINILSPRKIEEMYSDMKSTVDEFINCEEENEGLKALVDDWIHWIPIITFPNGDAFCIDKRSSNKPVVLLEHDVMYGGPNLHGLKIATNFDVLMQNWTRINFVDIYDWSLVVNEDGIDLTKTIFDSMLGRK